MKAVIQIKPLGPAVLPSARQRSFDVRIESLEILAALPGVFVDLRCV
ncbi:hypothetical protein [Xanthomonas sp. 10-10]|uniref:Uncharacterized protein n=1 Tax=Xanthomonas sp. 10-10 TaxID=3115848 RepID=A0AAU7P9E2_9XANT